MNVYNYLLQHQNVADVLYQIGVIPPTIERDVELYRCFAELATLNPKRTINWCATHVAKTKNVSNTTVYRAIEKMEKIL